MCYSAMVQQNAKKLGLKYKARVQLDMVENILTKRLEGEPIKLALAFDKYLLTSAENAQEKKLKKMVEEIHRQQVAEFEAEIFKQKKRFNEAEKKLSLKSTKAAENDKRISSQKIKGLLKKIEKYQKMELQESDSRIYPKMFSPLIVEEEGERKIILARYHMRPSYEGEDFDKSHDGCYNARQDSLLNVKFWRETLGKNHGILPITKFFENVYKNVDGKMQNLVLSFEPREGGDVIIPALYDHWKKGKDEFDSFAIITSDPNPEVKAAGHDRTPIALKDENIETWLNPKSLGKKEFVEFLDDKRSFYFENSAVA